MSEQHRQLRGDLFFSADEFDGAEDSLTEDSGTDESFDCDDYLPARGLPRETRHQLLRELIIRGGPQACNRKSKALRAICDSNVRLFGSRNSKTRHRIQQFVNKLKTRDLFKEACKELNCPAPPRSPLSEANVTPKKVSGVSIKNPPLINSPALRRSSTMPRFDRDAVDHVLDLDFEQLETLTGVYGIIIRRFENIKHDGHLIRGMQVLLLDSHYKDTEPSSKSYKMEIVGSNEIVLSKPTFSYCHRAGFASFIREHANQTDDELVHTHIAFHNDFKDRVTRILIRLPEDIRIESKYFTKPPRRGAPREVKSDVTLYPVDYEVAATAGAFIVRDWRASAAFTVVFYEENERVVDIPKNDDVENFQNLSDSFAHQCHVGWKDEADEVRRPRSSRRSSSSRVEHPYDTARRRQLETEELRRKEEQRRLQDELERQQVRLDEQEFRMQKEKQRILEEARRQCMVDEGLRRAKELGLRRAKEEVQSAEFLRMQKEVAQLKDEKRAWSMEHKTAGQGVATKPTPKSVPTDVYMDDPTSDRKRPLDDITVESQGRHPHAHTVTSSQSATSLAREAVSLSSGDSAGKSHLEEYVVFGESELDSKAVWADAATCTLNHERSEGSGRPNPIHESDY